MSSSANTNRIAKNTLILYFRMLLSMVVSIYTSRVILASLGIDDYGIYNVVGGLVGMFGIVTATLNVAINRFLTYELGRGDIAKLKRVFSTALIVQMLLSLIVVIVAETIGLWYVNNVMVIEPNRLAAANWCYQFSILSAVIGLIIVPYNSDIIAHERMSIYAYLSIIGVFLQLGIAYLVEYSPFDRLVFYGALLLCVTIFVFIVNVIYCRRNFAEATCSLILDRGLLKQIFSFSGWNFIGAGSGIARDYGGNLLINFYFGPAVNAAMGLSNSIKVAVYNFSSNFMTAVNPQITKSYAKEEYDYMFKLIFSSSKLSVFMMLMIATPLMLNMQFVLELWLKEVPTYTASFAILILIYTMVETMSSPLVTAMLATGNIKRYQIVVGGIQCLNIPLAWLLLECGFIPVTVVIVSIIIALCTFAARLYMLRGLIGLDVSSFLRNVYFRILLVVIVGYIFPLITKFLLPEGWLNFVITCIVSVISLGAAIWFIGCNATEQEFVRSKIRAIFKRVLTKQ